VAIPYFVSDELDFFSELEESAGLALESEPEPFDLDDSSDLCDPFPEELLELFA